MTEIRGGDVVRFRSPETGDLMVGSVVNGTKDHITVRTDGSLYREWFLDRNNGSLERLGGENLSTPVRGDRVVVMRALTKVTDGYIGETGTVKWVSSPFLQYEVELDEGGAQHFNRQELRVIDQKNKEASVSTTDDTDESPTWRKRYFDLVRAIEKKATELDWCSQWETFKRDNDVLKPPLPDAPNGAYAVVKFGNALYTSTTSQNNINHNAPSWYDLYQPRGQRYTWRQLCMGHGEEFTVIHEGEAP